MNHPNARFREFIEDPRHSVPLAVAGGAVKGALVGLVIGKLALATVAGMAGGAALGAAVSWNARRRGASVKPAPTPALPKPQS